MRDNSPAAKAARAHRAKKDRKPKEVYDIKELRVAGRVRKDNDLWTVSGLRWRDAHRWIPVSIRLIQAFCLIGTLAAIVSLVSVLMRDPPVLLLAYPDGSIRCAPPALDVNTGQPQARPSSEAALCDQLSKKFEG